MARAVLLAQYFPPETNAGANRVGPLADALAAAHELTVVTLKPSFPTPEAYSAEAVREADRARGYRVRRAFHFLPHSRSLAVRAAREQGMASALGSLAVLQPADVVIVSTPSMFLGPVAVAVARLRRARLVWDLRDLTWQLARELGLGGPALGLLERTMWSALGRADLIVSATPGITAELDRRGLGPKTITILNLLSEELREALARQPAPLPKERPAIAYTGLIGHSQGLGVLLDVAARMPEADFVLAGDGPDREDLERRAQERGLANARFTGWLDREAILAVYRDADVLFVQTRDTPYTNATVLPVKMFEYMASGRPFVYAGRGLAVDLLEEIECGVVVAPHDGEGIERALRELLADEERRRELAARGRAYVEQTQSRERLAEVVVDALRERLGV